MSKNRTTLQLLCRSLGESVRENEPLAPHTTFKIGGPAEYFFVAKSPDDVVAAVRAAKEQGIGVTPLGGGSNVLVSDQGVRGLVIKLQMLSFEYLADSRVRADAGVNLMRLVNDTAQHGLTGLEFGAGIFGTVGGAIRGNAGCFGREMKDVVVDVESVDLNGERHRRSNADCQFSYRESVFKQVSEVILQATLQLAPDTSGAARQTLQGYIKQKWGSQPVQHPNTGCIFKNIPWDDQIAADIRKRGLNPDQFQSAGFISAGWLVDQAGLKGKQIGQAQISELHGNFIINLGQATADQVAQLISLTKQQVRDQFGVQLQEEIRYLGFGV